ncbi:MAG: YtfJ family protein [Myxococcales bacterium]|nr:hypothetical protein [Myxococcota bacterium]MDW8282809.1 YtfJ family protein [Myxococcales bacterium]
MRCVALGLLLLPAVVLGAASLPAGQDLSDLVLAHLDDRPAPLRALRGRVVALIHEDRSTRPEQNQLLKEALGAAAERHRGRFLLFALADVSSYDIWPARRFAKEALYKVAATGASVLCDWKGVVRGRLGLRRGDSTLIVLSTEGRVALLQRGPHSTQEVRAVLERIGQLVQ